MKEGFEVLLSIQSGILQYLAEGRGIDLRGMDNAPCCFRTAQGFFLEVYELEGFVHLRIWSPWGGLSLALMPQEWWDIIDHIVFSHIGGDKPDPYSPRPDSRLFPIRRPYLPTPRLFEADEQAKDEVAIREKALEWHNHHQGTQEATHSV